MTLCVMRNPYATNVSRNLVELAAELNVPVRVVDLVTLTVDVGINGETKVLDGNGLVEVTSIAPYLLFGYPVASHALRILSQAAYVQNPVDSVLTADDKAATAVRLSAASVPQVPTTVCRMDLESALSIAKEIGYPVILKRTHGAQGRWVRRAEKPVLLEAAFRELESEGPGALVLQPEVSEFFGRSIRAIVTGGEFRAATIRIAAGNEWRSNIAGGASQEPVDLTTEERELATHASQALGLGHAGIDILRTACGPLVLEVNSCPDFTSMLPYYGADLGRAVLFGCLAPADG